MPFFYKHSTNNAQTSNEYGGRKGMGLNCHGLLWAKMTMGRIDHRLLFAAKTLILSNFASLLSMPMPTECLRPCQQNVYAQQKLCMLLATCCLFSFCWFLASLLLLNYIILKAENFDISDVILQSAGAD